MTILRVRILEKTGCFLGRNGSYYNMDIDQLIISFLPISFQYVIVKEDEQADICLFSLCLTNKDELRDNEINIMICIENCSYFSHYPHINIYGEFGNEKIDIYYYNHHSKLFYQQNKLVIPTIYARINHFQIFNQFVNLTNLEFKDRKFCLMINRSGLNPLINEFYSKLQEIGEVDNIRNCNISINSSCYNSPEILNLFGQYKFIICFENSKNDGYITEKIFNCFFSNSIPLYWGSDKIFDFFNYDSLLKVDDVQNFNFEKLRLINENEDIFNEIICQKKINPLFDNNNCYTLVEDIIKSKLKL